MFRKLSRSDRSAATIRVQGRDVICEEGENLAAVLLREGFSPFRTTPVSASPRLPYCMMGSCFECLAVVDGESNQQTCMLVVRSGMTIERQIGAPDAASRAFGGLSDE